MENLFHPAPIGGHGLPNAHRRTHSPQENELPADGSESFRSRLNQDGQPVASELQWQGRARRLTFSRTMEKYDYSFASPGVRLPKAPSWFIPFAYAFSAILLGFTLPRLEARFLPNWKARLSPNAAMVLYSSVAQGMMTLTGIVFSLAFVMVQFSATAYSPRLVLWMSRDPLISHALGVFTATFLYALAALAWVDRQSTGRIPFISAWLVVGLLLASVGVFVGLVQSLSRLQINRVLAFTGDFARKIIDVMYAPLPRPEIRAGSVDLRSKRVTRNVTYHGPPRIIQSLDLSALLNLAERADATIEMASGVGDTLVKGTPMLRVYRATGSGAFAGGAIDPIDVRLLKRAVRTGSQRTFEQDPKYSIHLLGDVAIRALCPAINDPTTAVQALDQIEDLLLRLGCRNLEIGEIHNSAGRLRLVIPVPTCHEFLDLAFSQIRSYGATSTQVMRRMTALLSDLIKALPGERQPGLRRQKQRLDAQISRSFPDIEDKNEASEEDREGFGATRRHSPDILPHVSGNGA